MASIALADAFLTALSAIATPTGVALLILGTLMGVLMGILPGLGGSITIALLIPLTFGMDPLVAFMLLVAANGGTGQGGAITAILINTPGKAPNAATILDGYPMARQGRAGEAIGASATVSALGAIFGIGMLVVLLPFMLEFVLLFGSPAIFWLGVWGLTMIAVIVRGNVLSGLISGGLGLLIAMHGVNSLTAQVRWGYGITNLLDGFDLVPALIGLFAVAEMINLVAKDEQIASDDVETMEVSGGRIEGVKSVWVHKWLFLRSALIGAVIGAIPGVGGTAANYVAYFQATQTERNPETFGTGDIRGVIASESSNDAKEGGAYIPTLGFGVPGSASMAVLFGAFLLHGITPGPLLLENHLDIVAIVILAALASNVISSAFTFTFADQLAKITRVDIVYIAPVVLGVAFFGSYALGNNIFNVWTTLFFGLLGFLMIKVDMSRIPLVLGMVLGPIIETQFFRSLQISRGDYGVFFRSPLAIGLMLLVVLSLLLPYLRAFVRDRGVLSS